MAQMWEVVGGADKGGILVREGKATASAQLPERLSTGALVEELEPVAQDRLHYKLVTGTGPVEGWVSIKLPGKDLLVKTDKRPEAAEPGAAIVVCSSIEGWLPRPHPAAKRCEEEWAKDCPAWPGISMEQFQEQHNNNEPGDRFGMKFPHNLEQIASKEYGAEWMTKAFHASKVLPADNRVKRIVSTKQLGGGGAADKGLVVVEYEKPSPELHEKLFMKFPYPMEGARRSDRMNSSVMLQQDCMEVDALRLLEAYLPFRVTKYYFSDISHKTSNFIVLTEFVNYGSTQKKLSDFVPFEIEPPYEKFLDDEQWGSRTWEYYKEMTKATALMSGHFKAGKFGNPDALAKYFPRSGFAPEGMDAKQFAVKMKMGVEFLSSVAKPLFPSDVVTPAAMEEWKRTLNIANAYTGEFGYIGSADDRYQVMMHGNMNADNTYWTRDESGQLLIGVIDWGGLGISAFPSKLWWCNYAAEFHFFEAHLDELLQLWCTTYQEAGGPEVEVAFVKRFFCIAAINQCIGLLGAIPQIYRVVSKKVWPEAKDRNFPKLKEHFLTRMYVQGFVLISTMIHRWNLGKELDAAIKEYGLPAKPLTELADEAGAILSSTRAGKGDGLTSARPAHPEYIFGLAQPWKQTASEKPGGGGPEVDVAFVKRFFCIAAINQCIGLLGAIPQIYRVVSKKVWPEVKDRNFPKLKEHFLTRMYVQGFVLIATMIHRWNLGKELDAAIKEYGLPVKPLTELAA
eukprot:CAMPEP_0204610872 /NCGR_PEP_ID=MMETSP0661-20131031/61730_1 /ASSEMBLY_ACC=CAM_ASM_000606 /TAXON_ID=109239 /ORGANISM="Alexandrium margalefi, Strain AMGDE01CS-322" /LENGTH=736 /DNA_ID=CAMNT_0051622699 /DNA_START=74 /DNA_END=2286 /DNA_ORIENTATION=-